MERQLDYSDTVNCVYIEKISADQFRALFAEFLGHTEVIGFGEQGNDGYNHCRKTMLNKIYERMVDESL